MDKVAVCRRSGIIMVDINTKQQIQPELEALCKNRPARYSTILVTADATWNKVWTLYHTEYNQKGNFDAGEPVPPFPAMPQSYVTGYLFASPK